MTKKNSLNMVVLLIGITLNASATDVTKIAIFDFELNDITSLPNVPEEIIRTASFKPLLESEFQKTGKYEIIQIDEQDYRAENSGLGYLYKFHDIAGSLGEKFGADWVVIGQHSKPSFLFSYLMVNVVNVKTKKLVDHFDIELKGNHKKVTEHGIRAIAKKIGNRIKQYNSN
ncbi:MAG: DUF3280 domain-containing protein [Methylococcaceae bacterium]|nr:DUF3280 domain-containing protein [Methylococcaceae bacterium]